MDANYFFYDGMYWVYQGDDWYASSWYNGPWSFVDSYSVPLYVLRVPVSYYRQPPAYFRGWQSNAPPRWGQHWGRDWEQRRNGWDRWRRSSAPAPAPLPAYQRKYTGDRYPKVDNQQVLHNKNYRYQPRDTVVREHVKQQGQQKAPASAVGHEPAQRGRQEMPAAINPMHNPKQQGAPADPHTQPAQRGGEHAQKAAPVQAPPQQYAPPGNDKRQQQGHEQKPPQRQQQGPAAVHEQQQPGAAPQHGQQAPNPQGQESGRDHGQGQGQGRDEGRGHDK
jgi:hypothetical protein